MTNLLNYDYYILNYVNKNVGGKFSPVKVIYTKPQFHLLAYKA